MKLIAQGAEAKIYHSGKKIIKDRIKKSYRHPQLDAKIRKRRTKAETKNLERASKIIPVPKILNSKDNKLTLEYIQGKKLSEYLDFIKNPKTICKQIGQSLAKLHDENIIHGDLTTSNLILSSKKPLSLSMLKSAQKYKNNYIYFIDFGLSFHSTKIEDKAVDLHLIKQALEAKHSKNHKSYFKAILSRYSPKEKTKILKRLETVEKRGRYKKGS